MTPWDGQRPEPGGYPLRVEERTRRELGPYLGEVAANLWPRDCQSCGQPLTGPEAALFVQAGQSVATATVHHDTCRSPGWRDSPPGPGLRLVAPATLNVAVLPFLLPFGEGSSRVHRPVLVVNPGLEQLVLRRHEGHWRVATVDYYARLGLRICTAEGLRITLSDPVPGASAVLDDRGVLTVVLGDRRAWVADCERTMAEHVRGLGGVAVAVSTACYPATGTGEVFDQLATAITTGQVASGWIASIPALPGSGGCAGCSSPPGAREPAALPR